MKLYIIGPGVADVGHGIISALIVSYLFNMELTVSYLILGIAAAFLPDLDGISELIKNKRVGASKNNVKDHRDGLHYPLLWIALFLIIYIFSPYTVSIVAVSVLLHFINDSWGTGWGVKWLWPFNNRSYKLFSRSDVDADTTLDQVITSWTPEEKDILMAEKGNPNWLKDCYGTMNYISTIEYGTFLLAAILLVLFW